VSIWDRFVGLFGTAKAASAEAGDEHGYYFYVRCSRCGELIRVRADRRWDFQQEFDSGRDAVAGYTLSKEVMGKQCFQMIRVTIHFDSRRQETEREIHGGQFVSREDFEAGQTASPS